MPFELGLAVACDRLVPNHHTWFVMESENRRLLKALSDLGGTLHASMPEILNRTGAKSVYEARVYKHLVVEASAFANNQVR